MYLYIYENFTQKGNVSLIFFDRLNRVGTINWTLQTNFSESNSNKQTIAHFNMGKTTDCDQV